MRSDLERLRDVIEATDKIAERVVGGRPRFDADEDRQLAIVRLLEIVGEACAHLSGVLLARYPAVPWRAAAGMRNRVIHGYFDVDLDVVWSAAADEVPELARAARLALNQLTTEEGQV